MNVKDLFPAPGSVRDIYCDNCGSHLDLAFSDFDDEVSGVHIAISGLPSLECPRCNASFLPDRSRAAIIETHRQAFAKRSDVVRVTRKKPSKDFGFTKVPFIYDPDDYNYIPGLFRTFDEGFLTPVFFSNEVLIKYDVHPSYRIKFASRTYGSILQADDFIVPFGLNRNGRVIMWLGDIAKLPDAEQYYLRSENVSSDHSIGSEFYDGQIECKFTDHPPEDLLFQVRSSFLEACMRHAGEKIAHLDKEVLELAVAIRRPIVDTPNERRAVADGLNKVYIESLDSKALLRLLTDRGQDAEKLGSLKRLQRLLELLAPKASIATAMSPLYVLYDLRVAYSHLASDAGQEARLRSIHERLGLPLAADLFSTYDALLLALTSAFQQLSKALTDQA